MFFTPIVTASLITLISLTGVFFFGDNKRLTGIQKHIVPVAVGTFLSLVLFELIPETLLYSPEYGGLAIAFGFITFYILASLLHQKYHHLAEEDCNRRGAAALLLIGDAVHNVSDGIILGGAFLIDPTIGFATAIGLALHEIPQEIIEFGVLIRAGYTRAEAAFYNLLSASSIIIGVIIILLIANHDTSYIWILTGFAAGNLLFIAASDLLPRIHGNLDHYGSIWRSALSITLGFILMTSMIIWTHSNLEDITATSNQNATITP